VAALSKSFDIPYFPLRQKVPDVSVEKAMVSVESKPQSLSKPDRKPVNRANLMKAIALGVKVDLAAIVGDELDGKYMYIVASEGTMEVMKKRRVGLTSDRATALTLIKRAKIDLACMQHGDQWKKHVSPEVFNHKMSPQEQELVQQTLDLIDETAQRWPQPSRQQDKWDLCSIVGEATRQEMRREEHETSSS
jgi:hypothetical protein